MLCTVGTFWALSHTLMHMWLGLAQFVGAAILASGTVTYVLAPWLSLRYHVACE